MSMTAQLHPLTAAESTTAQLHLPAGAAGPDIRQPAQREPAAAVSHETAAGLVLLDSDRSILYADEGFCGLLGYAEIEILATGLPALTAVEDREAVVGPIVRLAGGLSESEPVELRLVHRLGHRVWALMIISVLRDTEGMPVHFTCRVQDITARKRAEEAVARLAAIVESSADAIIATGPDGRITSWNVGAERIYGRRAAEVLGRSISVLMPPDHSHELPQLVEQVARGERVDQHETVHLRGDGARLTVSVALSPVRDGKGAVSGISVIARDVSEQRRVEARLRASEAQRRRGAEAARLLQGQLEIFGQQDLSGVLSATASAGRRLGVDCYLGCLLWDGGVGAWYLTALLDPSGRPRDLFSVGVPAGPFAFSIPPNAAPRPLAELMGEAWGVDACAELEGRLGTTTVLCMPVYGAAGPRGALLALLNNDGQAPLLAGVLAHAATAAGRQIDHRPAAATNGILDPRAFAERAAHEIGRSERYRRPLALLVVEFERAGHLAEHGPALARHLGAWDILGRLDGERPAMGVVLPETDRGRALALIRDLNAVQPGLPAGAALLPEDGGSLERLLAAARGRAAWAATPGRRGATPEQERVWTRGAPAGPDADTVRCPRCLAAYTRAARAGEPHAHKDIHRALRAILQADCPRHPDWIAA